MPSHVVVRVAEAISQVDAILVGGQAVNFWAEVYQPFIPELVEFGPFTSKDVDFFGTSKAACMLANLLGGTIHLPSFDDHTVNTAIVTANLGGHEVKIDFLRNVLGVPHKTERRFVHLTVTVTEDEGGSRDFPLKIMHPVHCIFSRVNTILNPAIMRTDEFSVKQIRAVYFIYREFIYEMIRLEKFKEVHRSIKDLAYFLYNDPLGRKAHIETPVDFLKVLKEIGGSPGLHSTYKEKTLAGFITRIEERRLKARASPLTV